MDRATARRIKRRGFDLAASSSIARAPDSRPSGESRMGREKPGDALKLGLRSGSFDPVAMAMPGSTPELTSLAPDQVLSNLWMVRSPALVESGQRINSDPRRAIPSSEVWGKCSAAGASTI